MNNTYINKYVVYMSAIKNRAPSTTNEYANDLIRFFNWLLESRGLDKDYSVDKALLESITIYDGYGYLKYKSENGVSAKTRARIVSSIRGFFIFLDKQENIKSNIVELEKPKIEKAIPKFLTLTEAENLISAAAESNNPERNVCIVTLFLNCGFRLSELSSIKVSDIRDNGSITILGKGRKERAVFLNDACIESVNNYLAVRGESGEQNLFLNKDGKSLTRRGVQEMVKNLLKKIGLPDYSTHKLRHTAATLMYQYGGADLLVLQEILGHESVSTTQIYTHINSHQVQQAISNNPLNKKPDGKIIQIA